MILALIYTAITPIQQPIQQPQTQTIYVANLSATDGRDAGAYYQVTTLPQPVQEPSYRMTIPVMAIPSMDNQQDQ
jgi:hypothetical protein